MAKAGELSEDRHLKALGGCIGGFFVEDEGDRLVAEVIFAVGL